MEFLNWLLEHDFLTTGSDWPQNLLVFARAVKLTLGSFLLCSGCLIDYVRRDRRQSIRSVMLVFEFLTFALSVSFFCRFLATFVPAFRFFITLDFITLVILFTVIVRLPNLIILLRSLPTPDEVDRVMFEKERQEQENIRLKTTLGIAQSINKNLELQITKLEAINESMTEKKPIQEVVADLEALKRGNFK